MKSRKTPTLVGSVDSNVVFCRKEEHHISSSALQHNLRLIGLSRHYAAIVGGVAAGILGLSGLFGVATFFVCTFISSFLILREINFDGKRYFMTIKDVIFGQLFSAVLSFILFWTLAYDLVYVF